jgi:hypothetical protein
MSTTTPEVPASLLVGGAWRSAADAFERVDPAAPDRVTGRYAAGTEADVAAASAAAAAGAASTADNGTASR